MRFIQAEKREDIIFRLCNEIAEDNEVRLIDAFIDNVDLVSHGFIFKTDKGEEIDLGGRSEYHPKALTKLYVYGYLNRIRSSRQFEKQCRINLELKWLMGNLEPSHNTINNFRKDNPKAILLLFRTFNNFWKDLGLFDDELMAIDGSFIGAQNSKDNNYSSKKLADRLAYIDKKTEDYLALLDQTDKTEKRDLAKPSSEQIEEKLNVLSKRKEKYTALNEKIIKSGETQISTTDSDARRLSKGHSSQMAYNVQMATEHSNKMIADFEVTNQGDSSAFHKLAKSTKDFLQDGDQRRTINGLGDKGYSDAEQIHKCEQDNIITFIAHKENINSKKDPRFTKSKFVYDPQEDTYQCPQKKYLTTTGKFYKDRNRRMKSYTVSFSVCQSCPFKQDCLSNHQLEKRKGKSISRYEFEHAKDANKKRVEENSEIYHLRKAIVEHPFGTIKRQWGYSYTLLKGFDKVTAEFALIFSVYNLRRAISILGVKQIIIRLKQAKTLFFYPFVILSNFIASRSNYIKQNLKNVVALTANHTAVILMF